MKATKSDKTGNNQKKPETRGRKPLVNKSIQVSWRIPHDIYQLLVKEQNRIEIDTGAEIPLSVVLQGLIKKHLN